jgi:hypothetical protein
MTRSRAAKRVGEPCVAFNGKNSRSARRGATIAGENRRKAERRRMAFRVKRIDHVEVFVRDIEASA